MKIFLNNQLKELSEPLSVSALLQQLQLPHTRGVAIAINNEVISRAEWDSHQLQENDKLTLIRATQGG